MIDTQTEDLLAAVHAALAVPPPVTPEMRPAYLEVCRDRSAAVHAALGYALLTGDLTRATEMVDEEAVAAPPVTYPTDPLWSLQVGVRR